MVSKHEKYEIAEIDRSAIKNADYNPRSLSNQARARLKAGIEKHGLVQPFVWNKRTGTLVGGHQRLSILDSLEGSSEYRVRVSVVDCDEKEERRLNVLLNNDSSAGFFDERKLLALFADDGAEVDYEAFGFSKDQGQYFTELMSDQDKENAALVEAMQAGVDFQDDIEQFDRDHEATAKAHGDKLLRKSAYEAKVESLLVKQDPTQWKATSEGEHKSLDDARNAYKNETFSYSFVKISFNSADSKRAWLEGFGLPMKDVIHESDLAPKARDEFLEEDGSPRIPEAVPASENH